MPLFGMFFLGKEFVNLIAKGGGILRGRGEVFTIFLEEGRKSISGEGRESM